jgi:ATP synthase protein I
MSENPDPERLKALAEKLEAATAPKARKTHGGGKYSGAGQAWQMVIELTTGMVIGVLIGLGLDAVTGLAPVFIVVFTLLGFAAGIRTMLRSAKEVQQEQLAEQAGKDDEGA